MSYDKEVTDPIVKKRNIVNFEKFQRPSNSKRGLLSSGYLVRIYHNAYLEFTRQEFHKNSKLLV